MFDLVKTLFTQQTYTMSRRSALTALAVLPLAQLQAHQQHQKSAPSPEEFLPECAASVTACWRLLNDGNGLSTVEQTLPAYLPTLLAWAQQPSRYQQVAAYLGAQGSLLMDLVAYHRFRFQDSLTYTNQAVELAKVSGDYNLHIYALMLQGGALNLNGQQRAMLQRHQEAEQYLEKVAQPLQSYVFAELAYAYAQNGQVQQALHCIGEARMLFCSDFGEVPCFISADYGLFQLILFEGMTHLALGESDPDHALQHNRQASKALAQIEGLSPQIIVPQRSRVEIVNYQAQAAAGTGNLDDFEHYLIAGAKGAKALGSEKRRQEVIANWKAARKVWPHETRVLELADVVV